MATTQQLKWCRYGGTLSTGRNKTQYSHPKYLKRSLERLCVMGYIPATKSKAVICKLIREYWHCLPGEQLAVLRAWCEGVIDT